MARCDQIAMKTRALAFLDRFRDADRNDALLDAMADDPDGLMATIKVMPDALLAAAQVAGQTQGPPVDLHPDSFASAACDAAGRLVVAAGRFAEWLGVLQPLERVVRQVVAGRPHVSAIADDRSGRPVAVVAAACAVALRWPLAPDVRAALASGAAAYAVIAYRPMQGAWDQAAHAYGLTRQETRLATALAMTGDLRVAAARTGVAYETARKLMQTAMRKVGVTRQAGLVQRVLAAAAGDLRTPDALEPMIAEVFGLTLRQARLALAVAQGTQRDEAGAGLGI